LAGTEVTQLSRRCPLMAPGGYFNRSRTLAFGHKTDIITAMRNVALGRP